MLIPFGTDAPIYHWPIGTISLIVINVAVFFVTGRLDREDQETWMLVLGNGLHFYQWITNNFMHAGLGHLIGNMIFLWGFGIIVEGKLGLLPFLATYFLIGLAYSASIQLLALGVSGGYVLGASAIIFGLLAISLIWAPKNELTCLLWLRFRPWIFDISILWFCTFYIAMEVLTVILLGRSEITSALLHVSGAIWGLIAGIVILKLGWVDCENWDVFALAQGRLGKPPGEAPTKVRKKKVVKSSGPRPAKPRRSSRTEDDDGAATEEKATTAHQRLRRAIDQGDAHAAFALYDKTVRTIAGWQPNDPEWLDLIKLLNAQKLWAESVKVMEDYLRRSPNPSVRVTIRLAQILIRDQQRPAHALKLLAQTPEDTLPESVRAVYRQLVAQAEQMREDGVLELEGEGW